MKPRLAGGGDTAARSDRRISRKSLALLVAMFGTLGGVGATVGIASPAAATTNTLYVSSFGSDSGNCTSSGSPCATVSYAVEQASSGDTVYVSGTIDDSVTVETSLTIAQWPGDSSAVLDGQGLNAVLLVFGVDVSLDGITLTDGGGSDGAGGAVDNYGGSLTIDGSSISDSTAAPGSSTVNGWGGGIFEQGGSLTISDSTISGNTTGSGDGAGDDMGGGIYNEGGTVSISDSTISDNTAAAGEGSNSGLGGGIYNSSGTVAISDSTISDNTAAAGAEFGGGSGGGIFDEGGTFSISESTISGNTAAASGGSGAGGGIFADISTLTVVDSTISGNTAPPADEGGGIFFGDGTNVLAGDIFGTPGGPPAGGECAGSTPRDDGYNVDDDGTCGFSATGSVSDSSAIDGYLGQLQNNGGPTFTVALLPGTSGTPNPAQAVIPTSFTAPGQSTAVCAQPDQRGASRVDPCDMGAYALTANLYALPDGTAPAPCTTESATPSLVCSFAAAVDEADSGTDDVINLEAPSGDTVYTGVSAGGVQAAITSSTAIQADIDPGFNSAVPVLDGENNGTVLSIPGNDDVTVTGIDIENGAAPFGSHGGAIFNGGTGTVSVSDSTFSDNSGGGGGAISNSNGGTLDVSDSTFTDNGSDGGGAIDNGTDDAGTGTLVVSDSTFYDNEARNYSGGAILNGYGSGDDGIATISDSTFYGNTAFFDDGGAVDNGSNGGTGTLAVANSTFVGTGGLVGAIENGGGSGTGTVTVTADVFADSCGQASGTWNDGGYNVGIDESCFDAGTADNDSAGSALSGLLGPLSDNGGPTQTVQPLAGNPAIGIVPNPVSELCPVTQDQRGYPSATGAACNAGAMQVIPSEQTIGSLSTAPSGVVVGGATYTPSATASSGLGVSITVDSSSSGVCTISAGVVSFTAVGTCTLDFNQAGNVNWAPAPERQQEVPVGIGPQTIGSLSNRPNDPVVGGPVYFPSATATSGLAVTITVDPSSSAVCSISAGMVSFIAVGTCAIDFNQVGNVNWLPATQVQQAIIIGRGTQTITVTSVAPSDAVVAGLTYTPSATASSGLGVSITVDSSSSAVCSISAGMVSFTEVGTCTVDFDQGGDVNWKAAPQVQQSFSVLGQAQTITVTSTGPSNAVVGGPAYTPSATATSGLAVTITVDSSSSLVCSISGGAVSFTEIGTCTVDFGQLGNATWAPAPQVQQSFSVLGQAQTITVTSTGPSNAVVGGPAYTPSATATSGLAVSITVDSSSLVCSISGGAVSFTAVGACTVDFDQLGNATWAPAQQESQSFTVKPTSGPGPKPAAPGYWMVAADGGVFSYVAAGFHGSDAGSPLNSAIVGMAATPSGKGYWLVSADGAIFTYGDADSYGSRAGSHLNAAIVGMAASPNGKGYWLVGADGGVFSYGTAGFHGSRAGSPLNSSIVGIAATPSGKGYWLVSADGAIFAYGDAVSYGSRAGSHLNAAIVGMAASPNSNGYWLVAADGGVFSYGSAGFHGSRAGSHLNAAIVGMAASPNGKGYWLVGADGGVFAYGDAPFHGSMGSTRLNRPVVGIAAG